MNDMERRAHDIAIRILPYTLKEHNPQFTYLEENRACSRDIVEEYALLYEALLKDLEEYGDF